MKIEELAGEESIAWNYDELRQMIRERAYELFLARGAGAGNEIQDWLEAEAEILWKLNH